MKIKKTKIPKRIIPYKYDENLDLKVKAISITIISDKSFNDDTKMIAKYIANSESYNSYHYIIGKDGIYNVVPEDKISYSSGEPLINAVTLSILLVNIDTVSLDNALDFIEQLCDKYNLNIEKDILYFSSISKRVRGISVINTNDYTIFKESLRQRIRSNH